MSHDIADTFAGLIGDIRAMTNSLSPRVRADIINYDPTQPGALSVTEFCRSQKISRSVFYKIRTRSQHESTATLHPRSRAPKQPARRYGPDVVNELVRIRKQLKTDGWDYGPKNHPLRSPRRRRLPRREGSLARHDRKALGQCRPRRSLPEEAAQILLHSLRQIHSHGPVAT